MYVGNIFVTHAQGAALNKLTDPSVEFKIRFKKAGWSGNTNTASDCIGGSTYPVAGLVVPEFTVVQEGIYGVVKHADITISQDLTGFTDARYWFIQWDDPGVSGTDSIVIGDFGEDRSIQTGDLWINFENVNGGELWKFGQTV